MNPENRGSTLLRNVGIYPPDDVMTKKSAIWITENLTKKLNLFILNFEDHCYRMKARKFNEFLLQCTGNNIHNQQKQAASSRWRGYVLPKRRTPTALQPRRSHSSQSPPWEFQIQLDVTIQTALFIFRGLDTQILIKFIKSAPILWEIRTWLVVHRSR